MPSPWLLFDISYQSGLGDNKDETDIEDDKLSPSLCKELSFNSVHPGQWMAHTYDNGHLPSILKDAPLHIIQTLGKILHIQPPDTPKVYKEKALDGTKNVSTTEQDIKLKMENIVHILLMVEQIFPIAQQQLKQYRFDWDTAEHQQFAAHALPRLSKALFPRLIFSESDVTHLAYLIIFDPAMCAILSVLADKITLNNDCSIGLTVCQRI
ncbi:hypothetical protein A0H81_05261 [Grifola frondosa]|uniref:Uncharacterized protein n=1 Tax=Grifola frondosa TaxID=5627 RepID=A0A1C7MD25_GRIFR|nr:hypothetical protein A0H81_05261 [Grifola frondosa]